MPLKAKRKIISGKVVCNEAPIWMMKESRNSEDQHGFYDRAWLETHLSLPGPSTQRGRFAQNRTERSYESRCDIVALNTALPMSFEKRPRLFLQSFHPYRNVGTSDQNIVLSAISLKTLQRRILLAKVKHIIVRSAPDQLVSQHPTAKGGALTSV